MTIHAVLKIKHFLCSNSTICTNTISLCLITMVPMNAFYSNKNSHTHIPSKRARFISPTVYTLLSFVKYSYCHLCQKSFYKFHFTIMDKNAGIAAKMLNHIVYILNDGCTFRTSVSSSF